MRRQQRCCVYTGNEQSLYHINAERQKQAQPRLARRSLKAKRSTNLHRDGLASGADDAESSGGSPSKKHKAENSTASVLEQITMRVRASVGTTKKQKLNGSGRCRAGVVQHVYCPVRLVEIIEALKNTPDIATIRALWLRYPRLFDSKFLLRRNATAAFEMVVRSNYVLNYVIPKALGDKLDSVVTDLLQMIAQGQFVDFPQRTIDLSSPSSRQCVAHLPTLRPFSEENTAELKEFYNISRLHGLYERDGLWLHPHGDDDEMRGDGETTVPYLQDNSKLCVKLRNGLALN